MPDLLWLTFRRPLWQRILRQLFERLGFDVLGEGRVAGCAAEMGVRGVPGGDSVIAHKTPVESYQRVFMLKLMKGRRKSPAHCTKALLH